MKLSVVPAAWYWSEFRKTTPPSHRSVPGAAPYHSAYALKDFSGHPAITVLLGIIMPAETRVGAGTAATGASVWNVLLGANTLTFCEFATAAPRSETSSGSNGA